MLCRTAISPSICHISWTVDTFSGLSCLQIYAFKSFLDISSRPACLDSVMVFCAGLSCSCAYIQSAENNILWSFIPYHAKKTLCAILYIFCLYIIKCLCSLLFYEHCHRKLNLHMITYMLRSVQIPFDCDVQIFVRPASA